MSIDIPNVVYLSFLFGLVVVSGVGEYLRLVPSGTLNAVILFILGHGSATSLLPTLQATKQNTQATQMNTEAIQQNGSPTLPTIQAVKS